MKLLHSFFADDNKSNGCAAGEGIKSKIFIYVHIKSMYLHSSIRTTIVYFAFLLNYETWNPPMLSKNI